MPPFRQTIRQSAVKNLDRPIPDINVFEGLVRDIIQKNPFGCTPYRGNRASHPPVELVRQLYTAKFVYLDDKKKQIGASSEIYHTIGGFRSGLHAVSANVANIAAHTGTIARNPGKDSFAATLKCHDAGGEIYFLNIARKRVTLSSYRDEAIRARIETWMSGIPSLA